MLDALLTPPISPSTRNGLLPPSILKKPPHSIGSNEMISSQSSDATACSSAGHNSDQVKKVMIALRLLTTMVLATGASSVMSLQFFLQVSWSGLIAKYVTMQGFYHIASEVGETLDVAVVICSTSAFFISLLQLFFVLKLYKSQNPNVALEYLDRTSFMRLVIYSFWFLSVILMMAGNPIPWQKCKNAAQHGNRTRDVTATKHLLYHCATQAGMVTCAAVVSSTLGP
ncbi:unnamed protein product [Heligmosomoides polygyrus]|uniref:CASP-like protein n=1 Tax=Heligmosomoides polygyrus TaxID=6339 RepID=A0A183GIQ2_HELPZ|nr:unnamed protein product [Heligmosomoides polygyrus]